MLRLELVLSRTKQAIFYRTRYFEYKILLTSQSQKDIFSFDS